MRIDIDGSRLYFDVDGVGYAIDGPSAEERPTLILLHGSPGTSDHTVFKPVFRRLTDVAQIVPGAAPHDLSRAVRSCLPRTRRHVAHGGLPRRAVDHPLPDPRLGRG
jgi:pimeloyl-ACP methyl ester carboxylesterase